MVRLQHTATTYLASWSILFFLYQTKYFEINEWELVLLDVKVNGYMWYIGMALYFTNYWCRNEVDKVGKHGSIDCCYGNRVLYVICLGPRLPPLNKVVPTLHANITP